MLIPTLISRLFEPIMMVVVLFVFSALRSGLVGWELVRVLGIIFSIMIGPPICILLWALKKKYVSNWDLSIRKERMRALTIFSFFLFVDWFFVQWVAPLYMVKMYIVFLTFFTGFFAITLFWKISGHMIYMTFLTCMFWYWYGPLALWLFLLLPLLGWSRLVLKRHSLGEVVGGTVYAIGIFFLAWGLHLI